MPDIDPNTTFTLAQLKAAIAAAPALSRAQEAGLWAAVGASVAAKAPARKTTITRSQFNALSPTEQARAARASTIVD